MGDMAEMEKAPWILDDPATMLATIIERGDGAPGRTLVGAVDDESRTLVDVESMDTPAPRPVPCYDRAGVARASMMLAGMGEGHRRVDLEGELALRLEDIARRLLTRRPRRPSTGRQARVHLFTVVCREGYTVQTAVEEQFRSAWGRVHLPDVSDGDVYVVTPHGWTGFLDQRCGLRPTVGPVPPSLSLVHRV